MKYQFKGKFIIAEAETIEENVALLAHMETSKPKQSVAKKSLWSSQPSKMNRDHIAAVLALQMGGVYEFKTVDWHGTSKPMNTFYYHADKTGMKLSVHKKWGKYVVTRVL